MAGKRSAPAPEVVPDIPERLAVADAPWLAPTRQRLQAAWRSGRFPHALLLVGRAGLGQSELALWVAQLALCEAADGRPCGGCGACVLFRSGNHPDLHRVTLEDDSKVVKVDQIRALSAVLAMRSYRGGYQVGIVDPADALNTNAFNALLKTLEEPSEQTLLVLVASRPSVLPATIVSRCLRLPMPVPTAAVAGTWLARRRPGTDWEQVLALAQGAPLAALDLAEAGVAELGPALARDLSQVGSAGFDPWRLAEAWHKDRPGERLLWIEHWVTGWLREALAAGDAVNNNRSSGLPRAAAGTNMGPVFAFLDRLRAARAAVEGPLNTQLLLEDLLVAMGEAFAAAQGRTG
ncbi:MAG: DNA polymerase III subunit delta' [Steroidobacteraceae bacterium]|jgi:DNA polymerase-3 subunit delta'|nr:DNA polymerase III subunit delta' [Steroidobacteraceae bacterium]